MKILKLLTPKRLLGNTGEKKAARFLRRHGYIILERNYVFGTGEIDIIAEKSDTLVFVEVKTRSKEKKSPKEPRPASALTPEKQRKIIYVAKQYKSKTQSDKKMRFDVIEVIKERDIKGRYIFNITHLIDAFNANTAKMSYTKGY